MRSFFDTNVLVYMFDMDAPEKKARAQSLLKEETAAGRAVLSTQVLQEFYVTVTRKLSVPLPSETAEEAVRNLAALPVVEVNADLILRAIKRARRASLSFWDALIVEAALSSGAGVLFTEDLQHGQGIEKLQIKNPFML